MDSVTTQFCFFIASKGHANEYEMGVCLQAAVKQLGCLDPKLGPAEDYGGAKRCKEAIVMLKKTGFSLSGLWYFTNETGPEVGHDGLSLRWELQVG